MTTPLVPSFIAKLFEEEVKKIQVDVVYRICEMFALDEHEVLESLDIRSVEFHNTQVKIVKKRETAYGSKTDTDKCIARVYDVYQHEFHQCKKSRISGCKFCKLHRGLRQKNALKWDTINDPLPKEITMKHVQKLY